MEPHLRRYHHTENDHNLDDPTILVPLFYEMFTPQSICDVGCGVGNFLYMFKQLGVKKVLGVDGSWVTPELLSKYLSPDEFISFDFENKGVLPFPKFDLCICLEVAEHISEENSTSFIEFLSTTSDLIIFSAALPFQGGINHVNEQKEEYWEAKFSKLGFAKFDIVRPQIFSNRKISPHYRRNIVVYSKKDLSQFKNIPYSDFSIQENCQDRLYKDLMANSLSASQLSKFFLKILLIKFLGRTLIRPIKKIMGKKV